jgi:hypothetical protein
VGDNDDKQQEHTADNLTRAGDGQRNKKRWQAKMASNKSMQLTRQGKREMDSNDKQ